MKRSSEAHDNEAGSAGRAPRQQDGGAASKPPSQKRGEHKNKRVKSEATARSDAPKERSRASKEEGSVAHAPQKEVRKGQLQEETTHESSPPAAAAAATVATAAVEGLKRHRSKEAHHRRRARAKENKKKRKIQLKSE